MPYSMRELTDSEKEAFLTENRFGVLAFTGDKPYVIPLAYRYTKGTLILGMVRSGRKMEYIKKNPRVCFNVWQMGAQSNIPSLKEQLYSSVILEGELEEIPEADRSYYEMQAPPAGIDSVSFRLKQSAVGTTAATQQ